MQQQQPTERQYVQPAGLLQQLVLPRRCMLLIVAHRHNQLLAVTGMVALQL
jgi:hypothetical protein